MVTNVKVNKVSVQKTICAVSEETFRSLQTKRFIVTSPEALHRLTRTAYVLRIIALACAGLSHADIGELLGSNANAVSQAIHRMKLKAKGKRSKKGGSRGAKATQARK